MHGKTQCWIILIWVYALTIVRGKDCSLADFESSRHYNENFDTSGLSATYPGGKQVRVPCAVGYAGFLKIICTEGNWRPIGQGCQPRSCGHPGDTPYAEFLLQNGEDFVFGSEVVYTCNNGYRMVSIKNVLRCMANGWDGHVPVCEAITCPPIHVDDNVQVIGDTEAATYGNVLRFTCKSNMILDGNSEIHCGDEGDWSNEPPKCTELKCFGPTIENGASPKNREYKENEMLTYTCNVRYTPTQSRASRCTKVGQRGVWIPTPLCEPTRCTLPEHTVLGTTYQTAGRTQFPPGNTVTVVCSTKYFIVIRRATSKVITCRDDGTWDHPPICQEIVCHNPEDINVVDTRFTSRWGGTKKMGDTHHYQCKTGFKSPNDREVATCTRDGWEPNPLCQEISCNKLEVQNAVIIRNDKSTGIYWYNEEVEYECRGNYEGSHTIRCEKKGWSQNPRCKEKTCKRPSDIQLTNKPAANAWTKTIGQTQMYTCKRGYKNKETSATCTVTGWTPDPLCEAITCNKQEVQNAVIIEDNKEIYRYNDVVKYECQGNFEGSHTIRCEGDGWKEISTCKARPGPSIDNGFSVAHNNKHYFACDEGYKPFRKGWWGEATFSKGVLSDSHRCIDEKRCGELPEIRFAAMTSTVDYKEGHSITITCKEGYISQSQVTCTGGEWDLGESSETICKPLTGCDPPTKVANAIPNNVSYRKKYEPGTVITYECRKGYIMAEDHSITCRDDGWESKAIACLRNNCTKPEGEEMTMTVTKETKDFIEYLCVESTVKSGGNATCVKGNWNHPVECKEPCRIQSFDDKYNLKELSEEIIIKSGESKTFECKEGYYQRDPKDLQNPKDPKNEMYNPKSEVKCKNGVIEYQSPVCDYQQEN